MGRSSAFDVSAVGALPDEERASLRRLLNSDSMSRAPRLQSVLKFLVDRYLEGKADEVNEQAIGEAVFKKPAGYNPGEDNIVRVTVRHLRARLEEFYRTEGADEPYILEIPKGKYVPVVIPRSLKAEAAEPPVDAAEASAVESAEASGVEQTEPPAATPTETGHPKPRTVRSLALVVCILALAAGLYSFFAFRRSESSAAPGKPGVLGLLLAHGNRVAVVVTDSNLQAYREIYKKQVSLDAYLNRSYMQVQPPSPDPAMTGAWQFATGTTETNVTSALVAAEIKRVGFPSVVTIKHPHDMTMRDFQDEDVVLLGGPWINPWGQMFEDRLNFRVAPREGAPAASVIRNLNPAQNEPGVFAPHSEGAMRVDYVRIAYLPGANEHSQAILLGATDLESLEAGGDFLVNPDSLRSIAGLLHVDPAGHIPFFESVLEVKGLSAVPQQVRIVAARTIKTTP